MENYCKQQNLGFINDSNIKSDLSAKGLHLKERGSCRLAKHFIESEVATRGVLSKKMFLEISQNSQENTCARVSFLIKLQAQFYPRKKDIYDQKQKK